MPYRQYHRTAHRMISPRKCRHLKSWVMGGLQEPSLSEAAICRCLAHKDSCEQDFATGPGEEGLVIHLLKSMMLESTAKCGAAVTPNPCHCQIRNSTAPHIAALSKPSDGASYVSHRSLSIQDVASGVSLDTTLFFQDQSDVFGPFVYPFRTLGEFYPLRLLSLKNFVVRATVLVSRVWIRIT